MQTAKLFKNGRSQAVRLPKEFRFEGDEVLIKRVGDTVVLMPVRRTLYDIMANLPPVSDDFMAEGREQPTEHQERPGLDDLFE